MIAFVDGVLVHGGREALVAVAGGGVGLDLLLSDHGAQQLPAVGERVKLWTHLSVREDGWTLYGFPTLDERAMFRLLVTVSGIGPKVALGMLSGAEPTVIARYLATGDEKGLARLPGIGKKSAARLVVELGQRVPPSLASGDAAGAAGGGSPRAAGGFGEALDVLEAMGLPLVRAEALLAAAREARPEVAADVQSWVRAALGGLGTPGR
ncbi:MAG: Holliday junction branch migration protein RuvA [Candidatus Krumholzibacteriia bacterium]